MQDYLTLDGVAVSYGNFVALPQVFLGIKAGEFFALLGPSGCGKTTMLNAIAGFVRASAGRITLDGQDITQLSPQKREIGVVFQSYALFPHMTAAENIAYGLKIRKAPRDETTKRVAEALSLVRLATKGDRYPRQLSGGEQQRVAIARALAIKPRLLLLDEPLSNLDARLRDEMRLELKRIQRTTGVTTVFVTHDQAEAFGAADRMAVIDRGHIKQIGAPADIYKRPASAFVATFIGRSNRLVGSYNRAARAIDVGGVKIAVHNAADRAIGEGTLYVRPEDMKLDAVEGSGNALAGRIESIVYGGATVDYRVSTALGELEVSAFAGQEQRQVGDQVTVSWSPEVGTLLENERL